MNDTDLSHGRRTRVRSTTDLTSYLEGHPDAQAFELTYLDARTEPRLLTAIEPIESTLQRPAAAPAIQCTPVDCRRDSFSVRIDAVERVALADPPARHYVADAETVSDEARGFHRLATADPHAIDVTGMIELLDRTPNDRSSRAETLAAIRVTAAARQADCIPAVSMIRRILRADDPAAPATSLAVLREIGAAAPEEIAPATETIRPFLASDLADARYEATRALAAIGEAYPADLAPSAEDLAAIVERGDRGRSHAVYALRLLAKSAPESIDPHVPALVTVATSESLSETDRVNATAALGAIVQESPSIGAAFVEEIATLLHAEDDRLRNNGVALLGDVARLHTDVVHPYVEELAASLTVGDRYARINASGTLARIAADFPASIRPLTRDFAELLDDDDPTVRKNACWALGHVRTDTALPQLQRLAGNDADADVRSKAMWAVSQIEGR